MLYVGISTSVHSVLYQCWCTSTHKHASSNRLRMTGLKVHIAIQFPPTALHLPCQQREEGILESLCSCLCDRLCTEDICLTAQPFVTKLGMVGHLLSTGVVWWKQIWLLSSRWWSICNQNTAFCFIFQIDGSFISQCPVKYWISVIQVTANVQYFS